MLFLYFCFFIIKCKDISSKTVIHYNTSILTNYSNSNEYLLSNKNIINNLRMLDDTESIKNLINNIKSLIKSPEGMKGFIEFLKGKIKHKTEDILDCLYDYLIVHNKSETLIYLIDNTPIVENIIKLIREKNPLSYTLEIIRNISNYENVTTFIIDFLSLYKNNFNLSSVLVSFMEELEDLVPLINYLQKSANLIMLGLDIFKNYDNTSKIVDIIFEHLINKSDTILSELKQLLDVVKNNNKTIPCIINQLKKDKDYNKNKILNNIMNVLGNNTDILINIFENLIGDNNNTIIKNRINQLNDIKNNIKNITGLKNCLPKFIGENRQIFEHIFTIFLKVIKDVSKEAQYIDYIMKAIVEVLEDYIEDLYNGDLTISEGCKKLLNISLLGKFNNSNETILAYPKYFLYKFLLDTSKNKNDLLSYDKCLYESNSIFSSIEIPSNIPIIVNSSYIVTIIDQTKEKFNDIKKNITLEKYYYIFSMCFPQGSKNGINYLNNTYYYCEKEDYNAIAKFILNFLTNTNSSKYDLYDSFYMKKEYDENEKSNIFDIICSLIPIYIIVIPIILYIIISALRNKVLKKNKKQSTIDMPLKRDYNENENSISDINNSLSEEKEIDNLLNGKNVPKWYKLLNEFFNLKDNLKELFNFESNNTNINNINGLNYIKGLMGFSIILTILGHTFLIFVNLPTKDFGINHFYNFIKNILYIFPFIGLRYSPRILFSCSGYILTYKYLSFIENQQKNFYFKFLLSQIYKYFYLILVILLGRFSIYYLFYMLNIGPSWEIFNNKILKKPESMTEFFLNLFMIKSFYISKDERKEIGNLFDYLWMSFNEIIFFILGTSLISIGYKFKFRIDYLIIGLIIFLYFGKITFFYIFRYKVQEIYTTLYYYLFDYGKLMINPLFNISYYLIGIYFGLMNYTIQKGITDLKTENTLKLFKNDNYFDKDEDENLEESKLKKRNISGYINPLDIYNNDDNCEEEEEDEESEKKKMIELNKRTATSVGGINNLNKKKKNFFGFDNPKTKDKKNTNPKKVNTKDLDPITYDNNYISKEINTMPFLISAVNIVKWHKNPKKKWCLIIILIILSFVALIFIIAHYIIIIPEDNEDSNNDKEKKEKKYSLKYLITNEVLNFFYLIDIELVVFYVQWMFFVFFINGLYTINDFYSHIFWSLFIKSYFSFLVSISPIILYVFYENNSIIFLDINNLYLYFFISLVLILVLMIYSYICLELPLKRIFKYLFREKAKINDNEDYFNMNNEDDEEYEDENEKNISNKKNKKNNIINRKSF